jgi:hypothetical protein
MLYSLETTVVHTTTLYTLETTFVPTLRNKSKQRRRRGRPWLKKKNTRLVLLGPLPLKKRVPTSQVPVPTKEEEEKKKTFRLPTHTKKKKKKKT